MANILLEEGSIWTFVFITMLLGGGAAWMTGRSAALDWRGYPALVFFLLLLALGVRFIHHALFDGNMFSLHYYIIDALVVLIVGSIGFRFTRTNQMVRQYHWLYERATPLSWRQRGSQ